jgi:malate dehydrogenase (oxaloacetate-decarboxylating)(NADP+)
VFASGSPFAAFPFQGRVYRPGQGNNAYVFPGIGLGAIACGMRTISDDIFLTAAQTLADMVSTADLAAGSVYPPLTDIREVSLAIALAVAEQAWARGLARDARPDDPEGTLADMMYDPVY